jgi:hypothetical protein
MCYYGGDEASPEKRRRIVALLTRWMHTDASGAFVGVRLRAVDASGLLGEIHREFGRTPTLREIATLRSMADLVEFLVRECGECA